MLRCPAQYCADGLVVIDSAYQLSSEIEVSIIPDFDTDPYSNPVPVKIPNPDHDPHPHPGADVATATLMICPCP